MELPVILPYVVIVVVGGIIWWRQRQCCAKLDRVIDWIKHSGTNPDGTNGASVDEWFQSAHGAICQIEDYIVNNAPLQDADKLCGVARQPDRSAPLPPPF